MAQRILIIGIALFLTWCIGTSTTVWMLTHGKSEASREGDPATADTPCISGPNTCPPFGVDDALSTAPRAITGIK